MATPTSQTFYLFGDLPKELRLLVWSMASLEPRTVSIRFRYNDESASEPWKLRYIYAATNPVPSILHACGEARIEGLKIYSREFAAGIYPRYTFMNFATDTVHLEREQFDSFRVADRVKIRKLRMDVPKREIFVDVVRIHNRGMWNLQELEIVTFGDAFPFADHAYNPTFDELLLVLGPFERYFGKREGWVMPTIRLSQLEKVSELESGSTGPPTVTWKETPCGLSMFDGQ